MAANYNSDGEVQVFSMQIEATDEVDDWNSHSIEKKFVDYTDAWDWAHLKEREMMEFYSKYKVTINLDWSFIPVEKWEEIKRKQEDYDE